MNAININWFYKIIKNKAWKEIEKFIFSLNPKELMFIKNDLKNFYFINY